jgi:hypothetical protein
MARQTKAPTVIRMVSSCRIEICSVPDEGTHCERRLHKCLSFIPMGFGPLGFGSLGLEAGVTPSVEPLDRSEFKRLMCRG